MRPQKRLIYIETDEISFVDKAANNRKFTVVKRANQENDKGGVDMSVADKYNESAKNKEFEDRINSMQEEVKKLTSGFEGVEKTVKDGVKVDTSGVEKTFEDRIKAINSTFEEEKEVLKGDYSELKDMVYTLTETVEKMALNFADMRKSMPIRKGIDAPAKKDYGNDKLTQVASVLKSLENPNVKKALLNGKVDIKDMLQTVLENAAG